MSRQRRVPRSLAQLFEPPRDFIGHFGWMCGYSADESFMNDAAERFTGLTAGRRAYDGRIALALMLDPGNPQISIISMPGVAHLPLADAPRPFNLLHAKVALLGFRREAEPFEWRLRLIVSTGNWTRQTLEESLDLAWSVEVSSSELIGERTAATKQRCADIKAAWELIGWLRGLFDVRLLLPQAALAGGPSTAVEGWVGAVVQSDDLPRPRFLDTREASILDQLPDRIRETGSAAARNYLAMGSGFFESAGDPDTVPTVLADVARVLIDQRLLTKGAEVDVFVNPKACQAVASAFPAIRRQNWRVRAPSTPPYFGKSARWLHAKFVFGAKYRDGSNSCINPWVYLGSGNITRHGFTQRMSSKSGNLEAGVVFGPDKLFWEAGQGAEPDTIVTNILPLQWHQEFDDVGADLSAGEDMVERPAQYLAPPLPFLIWRSKDPLSEAGELVIPDGHASAPFQILDPSGTPLPLSMDGQSLWPWGKPRQVQVRWNVDTEQRSCSVPVVDSYGRVGATQLHALTMEEAWLQLDSFPMPPPDDDLPDGESMMEEEWKGAAPGPTEDNSYPIREMMELVEKIADRQVRLGDVDWSSWCNRLDQLLSQAAGSPTIQHFHRLGINPLSPLWHREFRPAFAEDASTSEGRRYEEVLGRIETAWQVRSLQVLGAPN